jgi:hypothetical protein
MGIFLVTWDLNKQRTNYDAARQALIAHLERYNHIKDQGLDSVWFLDSSSNADAVCADIRTRLNDNDRVMVTQITFGQHQGWLDQAVWDWINARL